MATNAYTEDQLVEQPAIGLFAEPGWQTVSTFEEIFGAGGTLGRGTPCKNVLLAGFRAEWGTVLRRSMAGGGCLLNTSRFCALCAFLRPFNP